MKFPFKLQFRDMERSDKLYNLVWDHVEQLEKFYDRIVSCEVVLSAPHKHKKHGLIYHVQIRLFVPGEDIFINYEPEINGAHKEAHVAIRDAFDAARRKLEDLIRRERGIVKEKAPMAEGKVSRLFPNEHCGFLLTPDQREIYFHENAVLYEDFEKLGIGDKVRFAEEMGEKGPQASSLAKISGLLS